MSVRRTTAQSRPGFTLIELLVVVGIIAVLLSIGLVAGASALSTARRGATERFLGAVSTGIEQFKADHGYYPPLLNKVRGATPVDAPLVSEAQPNAFAPQAGSGPAGPVAEARYFSLYSLAAYLVGVGDINGDGITNYNNPAPAPGAPANPNLDDGVDGPGLRSPGPDRSWGGATRRAQGLPSQATDPPIPPQTGRVFGPYIDVANSKNLRRQRAATDFATEDPALRPQAAPGDLELYIVADRWETPIRYYRYWPTRQDMTQPSSPASLRQAPVELLSVEGVDEFRGNAGATGAADSRLYSAPYALLSAGEDALYGESDTEPDPAARLFARELNTLADQRFKTVRKRISDNVRFIP